MEEINTVKFNKGKKHNERYNININSSSQNRLERSYDNAINRKVASQKFTSYNITSENHNRRKIYKNITKFIQ